MDFTSISLSFHLDFTSMSLTQNHSSTRLGFRNYCSRILFEHTVRRCGSVTLYSVSPGSALLHSVHVYARVHTSIYIYIEREIYVPTHIVNSTAGCSVFKYTCIYIYIYIYIPIQCCQTSWAQKPLSGLRVLVVVAVGRRHVFLVLMLCTYNRDLTFQNA